MLGGRLWRGGGETAVGLAPVVQAVGPFLQDERRIDYAALHMGICRCRRGHRGSLRRVGHYGARRVRSRNRASGHQAVADGCREAGGVLRRQACGGSTKQSQTAAQQPAKTKVSSSDGTKSQMSEENQLLLKMQIEIKASSGGPTADHVTKANKLVGQLKAEGRATGATCVAGADSRSEARGGGPGGRQLSGT